MATSGRRTGAETRSEILEAAACAFRDLGYERATLGGIAETLGITRSAVLHYFDTKETVLHEVVAPFVAQVDNLLDARERSEPVTVETRRRLVTEFVDLVSENRCTVAILAQDVSVHHRLGPTLQLADRVARLARLTMVESDDPEAPTRALAALGAILRPVRTSDEIIDLTRPETRLVLVEAAMAVLSSSTTSGPT